MRFSYAFATFALVSISAVLALPAHSQKTPSTTQPADAANVALHATPLPPSVSPELPPADVNTHLTVHPTPTKLKKRQVQLHTGRLTPHQHELQALLHTRQQEANEKRARKHADVAKEADGKIQSHMGKNNDKKVTQYKNEGDVQRALSNHYAAAASANEAAAVHHTNMKEVETLRNKYNVAGDLPQTAEPNDIAQFEKHKSQAEDILGRFNHFNAESNAAIRPDRLQ
ncbi:hypothetical protein FRC17_000313 [Serendipita sp. 399]|nr:hypothetical protein FRC17_000313 [Serendipita sp. 399]